MGKHTQLGLDVLADIFDSNNTEDTDANNDYRS